MLSSITPLGERGRNRSWRVTVAFFVLGAVVSGSLVFGAAGWAGQMIGLPGELAWVGIGLLIVAAVADLLRIRPPGPHRQVSEDWLGEYRGWVVGLGYGLQLGSGFATIVPSFANWALLVLALMAGPGPGLLGGLAFGLGRSLLVMAGGNVNSPSGLARRMRAFNRWQQRVAIGTVAAQVAVIALAIGALR